MTIPERVAYGDWSLDLHRKVIAGRVPASGTIEVTRRCNLTCSHCYNNLPMRDLGARSSELTLEEHRRIVDQVAAAGCLWLLYTGGEVFARKDFLEIYGHARNQGLLLTIFTNGTILTPRIADALAEQPPFGIEITLYGRTRGTYEALTRAPGSYDRCLRGIELLLERKLPLKLKTVAVSINAHEVWEIKSFAKELGCEFSFDSMINPRIDCSLSPLAVRLTPREIVELDLRDPERVREWNRFASVFLAAPQAPDKTDEVYHCGGGVSSFAIDPEGKMSICVLSHQEKFDLRGGSFREGWELFLRGVRAKKIGRPTKCTACHLKSICGMCPANGELEHGDAEKPVDFLCHVAHLRAGLFGWTVPAHGECEYCSGGSRQSVVDKEAAELRRLAEQLAKSAAPAPQRRGGLRVLGEPAPAAGSGEGCGSPGGCGCAAGG